MNSLGWMVKFVLGLASRIPAKKHLPALIVEDNHDDALLLQAYVEDTDASAIIVHTLADADDLLRRQSFRLVFVDIRFPTGNGIEWAKRLRGTHKKLPVVFVTGNITELERLPSGSKWSFIVKGGSLMEGVRDALAEANGLNGEVKPGELAIIVWALLILSIAIGFVAGVKGHELVKLLVNL